MNERQGKLIGSGDRLAVLEWSFCLRGRRRRRHHLLSLVGEGAAAEGESVGWEMGGIFLDIGGEALPVEATANDVVEGFWLPECAAAMEEAVDAAGADGFPGLQDVGKIRGIG